MLVQFKMLWKNKKKKFLYVVSAKKAKIKN